MDAHERLRITLVTDTWDGAGRNGGVQSARRFVAALRRHHHVTVVTTGEPAQASADHVILPSFYVPGFRRVMRENGFPFAWPSRRRLEEVFRASDVVHIQFPFPLGIRAATLAQRLHRPIAAGFHVQAENLFYNIGIHWDWLTAATYRFFLRTLYNKADEVICPSEFALDELRRYGLRVPAVVISNGITDGFRPEPAERPERHRGRFLVLAVGRLAREKRLDVIIEGVRRSRNAGRIQLVVTGSGPEAKRVAELGATLPSPAEVTFVSDDELKRLLRTADLLVHASEVELEGMAVLEALGCGLPALVADAPLSAARQFAASPDFLFRPGDADDLARHLDLLLERPEAILGARERCLALRSRYSFDESVRLQEAVYRRLASPPVASAAPP
jgi:glycosyltransferase involved in cell wall biosynthesis